MADDLGKFIESQKSKLERERAELSRDGDFASTSRQEHYNASSSNRRNNPVSTSPSRGGPASLSNADETGLPLGGYDSHRKKLNEERKQEYNKFLAEKKLRSTGRADEAPIPRDQPSTTKDTPLKSIQKPVERQSYERDYFSPLPPRSSRRRGKENFDDMEESFEIRAPRRRAPNKTDSYEDLLRRKRAEERRYRSRFEEQDFDDDLRHMRLSSKNYKFNSKSDGFLSRQRYDDDDLDDEDPYGPRSRRSRRVRFTDDDDMDDSQWLRRRRLQDLDDEYDEDFEDLREQSRRRRQKSRVSQRISSAHEERRTAAPEVETDMRRTKTDSELRSASAPLPEGTGIIGGREEPKALKLQEKERYRKELEKQRQEQEDKRKQERMERLGIGMESSPFTSQSSRPQEPNQKPPPGRQPLYSPPPSTYIPSSHPPPHPAVQPNPYDDPYFYYGGQERAAPQPSSVTVPPLGVGFASAFGNRYDRGIQQELTPRGRAPPSDPSPPETQAYQSAYEGDPHHQPPGGFSNIGRDDSSDSQKKRATQQALRDELERQMKEHAQKKEKEKIEKERYERKMEAEIEAYNPWGKGGGGAPLRDQTGHLVTDLKKMHQYNQEGKIVSPRDPPPAKDIRFELPPEVNKISPEPAYPDQSGGDMGRTSSFGRSDPLKTKQPQDDIKMKAKLEYQLYLKQQVEEKERKKKEEQEKIKREEELEEQRLEEQRIKMQKEFEEEQEKARRKEEEVRKRNEEMKAAQEAKKKQEDRRRKELDEEREAELARKLDAEIAAKKAAGAMAARSSSPPIPTLRAKQEAADYTDASRIASPPIPTLANQRRHESPVPVSKPVYQEQGPSSRLDNDSDVLSQLTALRKQLKNEENKIQSQIGRMDATTKYQQIGQRRETDSRRSRREVDVFDRVRLSNKPGPPPLTTRRNGETSNNAAAEEFNKIKYEETSSLAGEFRSRFPQPAQTDSVLDLQQQEYLREQEDKISSLKAGFARSRPFGLNAQGPIRSKSKESLLDSESQFIAVDGPAADLPSLSQVDLRPRQSSARQRRRWKELEERAKEQNPYNAYKPPTPGGFSLNSVTSFNVDEVATKNDERLRRLDSIRRADAGDPEQVLQQFMNEHRRPLTRTSETSLEAETSFEPLPF
ncbi:centrosome and spindle pole-associated protein 1 isoform X3 [Nematostella vectensis]|uniref:centrosome and spindle pole-associated protein 1 isoform X3 n=1 Tax=Nematostella vectensis TaxID=45351 RepID=UPI0020774D4D|nr:centrosome and spindle pole-associated protein 1 isoform X3 [Nematostella vectensis]